MPRRWPACSSDWDWSAAPPKPPRVLSILGVPYSFLSSAFLPVDNDARRTAGFLGLAAADVHGRHLARSAGRSHRDSNLRRLPPFYDLGSVLWSVVLLAVAVPLVLRAYRKA